MSSLEVWGIFIYFCSKIWPHICDKTDTMASGDMYPQYYFLQSRSLHL